MDVSVERAGASHEFLFTDSDFQYLRKLIKEKTGIALSEIKRGMVYGRLSRRLRALDMDDFRSYCELLEKSPEGELKSLINAITTNLTSFFREPHHFEHLRKEALPHLMKVNAQTRRLRVWSSGCSTGEEPYTIAIILRESMPEKGGWDFRILATDLDTDVLDKAENAVYPLERLDNVSSGIQKRWFKRGRDSHAGLARVSSEIRSLISFRQLNLIESWPMRGPFDIVFCRNVVIYFDKETQRKIFDKYADLMSDESYLYIGHSESLYRVTDRFELLGKTIYKKRR